MQALSLYLINTTMANSLQDQLLNTGLASAEQLQQARDAKKKPVRKPRKQTPSSSNQSQQAEKKPPKPKKEASDLAQFYKKRTKFERNEREREARERKEAKLLRKQNAQKIRKIVLDHIQNVDGAEIRYNFIVGTNIKYLHVTEEQQDALSAGTLAITFLGGRRCLIPVDIIDQLREIEPSKLIIVPSAKE